MVMFVRKAGICVRRGSRQNSRGKWYLRPSEHDSARGPNGGKGEVSLIVLPSASGLEVTACFERGYFARTFSALPEWAWFADFIAMSDQSSGGKFNAVWMAVGTGVGVALGTATKNVAIGLSCGVAIGVALGFVLPRKG